MTEILTVLGGYLVGAIPFSFLVGRWRRRDLRSLGTGNLGASNTYRQVGKAWGALVLLLDLSKVLLPMLALHYYWEPGWAPTLWALSAFVGHCWPVWLGFRPAGRGIAVLAGMFVGFGFIEATPAYVLGAIAGYAAGLAVRRPGLAIVVQVCGAIVEGVAIQAGAPVLAGSMLGAALMLARRAVQLPRALATGSSRGAAIWLVLAEDIVPGQSI